MLHLFIYLIVTSLSGNFAGNYRDTCEKINPYNNVEFLTGKTFAPSDSLFSALPPQCSNYGSQYLLCEAADSFNAMYAAAKKDGIVLQVVSAYRSFDIQKKLWENSWAKNRRSFRDDNGLSAYILRYLSMPCTSRHHWGTEVDVCSTALSWWQTLYGQKTYRWLENNAAKYGFYQPYGPLGPVRKSGYQEEKWHWSFAPLASQFIVFYNNSVGYQHITGFSGSNTAAFHRVIENYVLSVDSVPSGLIRL
ncbi:MAG: M15 family metallopeptidase [Bacteroidales bacterium]|nr:M15 family metallopeptidase [Bacteroidales bacterium]HOY38332.1 M15 family metallopeptidase [Bacteroidales bacterium]HQP03427.1 M15 family metallopeptidase [Bacteroidales bacterium]